MSLSVVVGVLLRHPGQLPVRVRPLYPASAPTHRRRALLHAHVPRQCVRQGRQVPPRVSHHLPRGPAAHHTGQSRDVRGQVRSALETGAYQFRDV